jgi:thymidylate synthase (FAD)
MEFVDRCTATLVNHSASDEMVAMAAWVSNGLDDETRLEDKTKVAGLINFLYKNKHMSPFEHGTFTWKIDCSLAVAREFQRHRTWSYNEVSGRYTQMEPRFFMGDEVRVQEGKMGNYYFVPGSAEQDAIYKQSKRRATKEAWMEYLIRLEAGIAKEQAREDLPLSLMTQFYATANPRNVMQFLTLRTSPHALKEIRELAQEMEKQFAEIMPLTYTAYQNAEHPRVEEAKKEETNIYNKITIQMDSGDPEAVAIGRQINKAIRALDQQAELRRGGVR